MSDITKIGTGLNFESEINDEDITVFVKLIFNK